MFRSEKFGHLHLVYHFTVPLNKIPQRVNSDAKIKPLKLQK